MDDSERAVRTLGQGSGVAYRLGRRGCVDRPGQETTMNDEVVRPEPSRTPARRSHRYKRHELELADGGRLVLGGDGSIARLDADGSKTHSWMPDDPGWPDQAIRFGLHPQVPTVKPEGRRVQGTRPPRG
jgi:hypothetical protein